MKVVIQHPASGRNWRTQDLSGIRFFGLLVLLAAFVGAASGLLLVYSTDLPQVEELEHYRPSSTTDLYDDSGRVIGTFALQRRVVASYDDYPQVLRDALVSIEDKDFYTHSGINFWRIVGAAYRDFESGGKGAGRFHSDHATGAQSVFIPGPLVLSQGAGVAARHPDRAPLHQAADFHALCQPDFSRTWRVRV